MVPHGEAPEASLLGPVGLRGQGYPFLHPSPLPLQGWSPKDHCLPDTSFPSSLLLQTLLDVPSPCPFQGAQPYHPPTLLVLLPHSRNPGTLLSTPTTTLHPAVPQGPLL